MPQAFDTIVVPTVPGSRMATLEIVADSANFTTTEVVVATLVVPIVIGRTYRIRFIAGFQSSVAGDQITCRLRQTSLGGAELQNMRVGVPNTSTTTGYELTMEREVTAGSTGDSTFVATAQGVSGATGDLRLEAGTNKPGYFYADYIRG